LAEGGLEVERLVRRYGDLVALQEMSLQVAAGELFGFVGANGSGKTTTMRIVMGVLAADSGEVRWGGAPVTFETHRRFGYMPEERGLYPKMRVLEQLAYLAQLHGVEPAAAGRSAIAWLERLGLSERRNDEVQKLSRGNQQRVQLAAALVFEPELLVLDEPFAGLDPVAVDVMSEVLRDRASAGIPVIFSSHQLDIVERLCDRVGIIKAGQMVVTGTVTELRSSGPARYWVDAPMAADDWTARLTGVKLVRREGTRTLLELADGTDDQAVLGAALATGPVHEFRRDIPPLSELFRHVIAETRAA
jgi:ABC-2 type transport system ATP-binding protein